MVNVRISRESLDLLRELAQEERQPMHAVLAKALEAYRRDQFLRSTNTAYKALRSDPVAWAEELEERRL